MMQKACLVGMALAAAGAPFAGAECAAAAAPQLPPPFATPSAVNFSKMIGWPEDRTPQAPPGFTVSLYADGLDYPRWLYVLPNGDLLVSESRTEPDTLSGVTDAEALRGLKESGYLGKSANRITLLRDGDGDGRPELR
jgi:glucose/arabinose dehydrogenase